MTVYKDLYGNHWTIRTAFADGTVEAYPCNPEGVAVGPPLRFSKDELQNSEQDTKIHNFAV